MANVPLLVYRRTDTLVKAWKTLEGVDEDGDGKDDRRLTHAGVGTLSVGGHSFDTFERLDGYVALDAGRTYLCRMETSSRKVTYELDGKTYSEPRQQLRPIGHGKQSEGSRARGAKEAAILIHPGKWPFHFIGCIGLGFREGNQLEQSAVCMWALLDLCGGYADGREVLLSVEGAVPKTPRH